MGDTGRCVGVVADEVVCEVIGAGGHRRFQRVVAVLGEAVLVHLEHVVSVHEVLVQQLPVGVPHIDLAMHRHVAGHAESTDDFGQAGQPWRQVGGVGILGDEEESLPLLESQRRRWWSAGSNGLPSMSTVRFMYGAPTNWPSRRYTQAWYGQVIRGCHSRATAANPGARTRCRRQTTARRRRAARRSTVPIRVRGVGRRDLGGQVVTDARHVCGTPDARPLRGEDAAMLFGQHLVRCVAAGGSIRPDSNGRDACSASSTQTGCSRADIQHLTFAPRQRRRGDAPRVAVELGDAELAVEQCLHHRTIGRKLVEQLV